MSKEVIELIDTAIKIGLGAFIVSISSYLISRYNHKAEERKDFVKRYISAIDTISENAEEYFQKWAVLISAIGGTSKQTTELNINATEEDWKYIFTADENFLESRKNRMTSISKLKLLGLNSVSDILEKCIEVDRELRELVIFKDIIPTNSELDIHEEKMENLREEFYKKLNQYYISSKNTSHNIG